MIVIGLLMAAAAGTCAGLLIADNLSAPALYSPHVLGHTLSAVSPVTVFCAGLALGFLLWLGVWIAGSAMDRWRHGRPDDPPETFMPGWWRPS